MAEEAKKIYIGSDHAGFRLKEALKRHMARKGIPFEDMGNHSLEPGDDYPDFAHKVAARVAATGGRGVLICDSGVGVCIVADKVKGVRGVNAASPRMAMRSREHNDTNVLCLGQEYLSEDEALSIFDVWLATGFSHEERHRRRVEKISRLEGD
ncbi:MAG: ribose 5-phosphate isomerase B [Thermodesulfovibrionales bacterium]